MSSFSRTTQKRLEQLPQSSSVWEGARLSLGSSVNQAEYHYSDTPADCIIWVDGLQGTVRALEVVPADVGMEATVRALLKAIEQPMDTAYGSPREERPQKVVVRDRELQFFLRGVLNPLGIIVEYHAHLPIIDDMTEGLIKFLQAPPCAPEEFATLLEHSAHELWDLAPWDWLQDHDIIAITLNDFETDTLYVSVMGNLGLEYGFLLYRSLDSLKRFRQRALDPSGPTTALEETFIQQDCLFVTYTSRHRHWDYRDSHDQDIPVPDLQDPDDNDPADPEDWQDDWTDLDLSMGSIHPLEGLRSQLHAEEARILCIALEALIRFLRKHRTALSAASPLPCQSRFRLKVPGLQAHAPNTTLMALPSVVAPEAKTKTLSVLVTTCPELAAELLALAEPHPTDSQSHLVRSPRSRDLAGVDSRSTPLLPQDDLIPDQAIVAIGCLPWSTYINLASLNSVFYQPVEVPIHPAGEGLPVIVIQTTRPRTKTLLAHLRQAQGLKAIGFSIAYDILSETACELGLLELGNGELQIFGYYDPDSNKHQKVRDRWLNQLEQTQGYCGLVIAQGATGSARGNPGLREMVALYEGRVLVHHHKG